MECWDEDSQWYMEQCARVGRLVTDADEEEFCERVAVKLAEGIADDDARIQAWEGMKK